MTEKASFRFIMALYFFFSLGYSLLMPMWEAPDEPDHYLYALFVARENRLPPPGHNIETSQPPLYYWLASLPLRIIDEIDPALADYYRPELVRDPNSPREFNWTPENYKFLAGPHILRWFGVAMGGLTLFFIYRSVRQFIPRHPSIALGTIALAGLTPQYLHISASVSNDVLANLAGALLFWLAAHSFGQPRQAGLIVPILFASILLTVFTKLNVLPVGLGFITYACWMAYIRWSNRRSQLIVTGVLIVVISAAGLISFFGEVTADLGRQLYFRMFYVRPDFLEIDLDDLGLFFAYSYWGSLGWLKVRLPGWLVVFLSGITLTGWVFNLISIISHRTRVKQVRLAIILIGSTVLALLFAPINSWIAVLIGASILWQIFVLRRGSEVQFFGNWKGWWVIWLILGLSFLALVKNIMATPQYQGRFLFPSVGMISLTAVAGWHTPLTHKWQRYVVPILVIVMVTANLILWIEGVLPAFYQPFLD